MEKLEIIKLEIGINININEARMNGGIRMHAMRYSKPNMTSLKGKRGRAILTEIRSMKARPTDDIRNEADACMNRILARRKNAR